MKKVLFLFAGMLFSSMAFSDPALFEMRLGGTTESELKSVYSVQLLGVSKYSGGNTYSVPVAEVNFEGLQKVTAVFDKGGILVAVFTVFPKTKFEYLNRALGDKYKLISQKIPHVGNKSAKYREGKTDILIEAPHMSFEMYMSYARDEFTQAYNEVVQSEARAKQSRESSQL